MTKPAPSPHAFPLRDLGFFSWATVLVAVLLQDIAALGIGLFTFFLGIAFLPVAFVCACVAWIGLGLTGLGQGSARHSVFGAVAGVLMFAGVSGIAALTDMPNESNVELGTTLSLALGISGPTMAQWAFNNDR